MYLNLNLRFLFFYSWLWISVCLVDSSEDEIRSLLEFKKGIEEDPLGHVTNSWIQSSSDGCPNNWHGIHCDDTGKFVTGIVLDELGLVGDLKFSTLIGLKMLQNLSLSGNSLTGRLVPSIGLITSLQRLDLSRNQFYGPIPAKINNLWGLNYLDLSSNNFTGGFPSGIKNLQQLKVFDLHLNRVWGDISDLFSELRNVEHVDLSYNLFYGGLSSDATKLSSLSNTVRYMNLSHNRLNGEFFSDDSIKLFKNLNVLDLGDNQIFGKLPSFGLVPNLQIFRAGSNQLQGPIPKELFETMIPLEELDLSGNGFSGLIPGINSTTLKSLNLSSNFLSGSLPSNVGSCMTLDLSRNMISGVISVMQNWSNTLEVLDLSSNTLEGSFPNVTSQFSTLVSINISNNTLVGSLPLALGNSPKLFSVDLGSNQLTGSIPTSFFTSMSLTNLNLSGNRFTGAIPFQGLRASELLVRSTSPPLESLDLSRNSLTGSLSPEVGILERLKLLNLGNNQLSGPIPSEMSKLTGLEYLDLSINNFIGKIPDGLSSGLKVFNVSANDLSGRIPENLETFPITSFQPGNHFSNLPKGMPTTDILSAESGGFHDRSKRRSSKSINRTAIIIASVGAAMMIAFVFLAYNHVRFHKVQGRNGFNSENRGKNVKLGRLTRRSFFKFYKTSEPPPPSSSLSFSNDHLLRSNSRSLSGQKEVITETLDPSLSDGRVVATEDAPDPPISGQGSSLASPLPSSPHFIDSYEQPVMLNVCSPDRLAGELFFLDSSILFTAEELSRAPAEVLGRSIHGTLYKASLDSGHMLSVKWLRVGLVKHKKEFAKEINKIGSFRHQNIVSLRAYYWGPRDQERLILADYVHGDNLALHLYEGTPRRNSPLSLRQRLKVAVDVATSLCYLHDRGFSHGNLKPTNILLTGTDLTARITDYALHRLMTSSGTAEQVLNLRAHGYGAPELTNSGKSVPSLMADVYAFGVILMELLTRRSAGDIISGQSGAVDLVDWVRLCAREGREMDCIDRDLAGVEEFLKPLTDLLSTSLKCILSVDERPSMRAIFEDLCSISV